MSRNKREVVFLEKNGLRHGEFKLPFEPQTFEIKGLDWSSDSSILVVWGCDLNKVGNETVGKSSKYTGEFKFYTDINFLKSNIYNLILIFQLRYGLVQITRGIRNKQCIKIRHRELFCNITNVTLRLSLGGNLSEAEVKGL